ncbi:MAG: hypothetical protein U0572_17180 [Phycisphaerales bacterium]
MSALAVSALADLVRYEIIDLAALSDSATEYGASAGYALNESLVVVGYSTPSSQTTTVHATAWAYCPIYGLPSGTWWSLVPYDLTGGGCPTLCKYATAYDINESGLAVGKQITDPPTNLIEAAFVWRVDTVASGLVSFALPPIPGAPPGASAVAFGVNDASPALVVGEGVYAVGSCAGQKLVDGWSWRYSTPPVVPNILPPLTGGIGVPPSSAHDVATTSAERIVGVSTDCAGFQYCDGTTSGVYWIAPTSAATEFPKAPIPGQYGAIGRTVANGRNNAGMTVGELKSSGYGCVRNAAFWDDAAPGAVLNLGLLRDPNGAEESFANDIADVTASGTVRVVGASVTSAAAVLWECVDCDLVSERMNPSRWTATILDDVISRNCGVHLLEAAEVNASGWIVGRGNRGGISGRGFLLRPIECLADLDHDCDIDAGDLGVLLGAWGGQCDVPCAGCHADLDADGIVGSADLGILLGRWGVPCSCTDPCAVGQGLAAAAPAATEPTPGGAESANVQLTEALGAIGFGSVEEFQEWLIDAPEDAAYALATLVASQLGNQ